MRTIILSLLASLCTLSLSGQTGKLVVWVEGIDVEKGGNISVGLFDEDGFPKTGQQKEGQNVLIDAARMKVVFENVPAGEYAIAVYQDFDKNNVMATNLVGYPTEPIGFSNDAKIFMGPPDFDDAAVQVDSGAVVELTVKIK